MNQSQNNRENDYSFDVFLSDQQFIAKLAQPSIKEIQILNISHTLLTDAALLQLAFLNSKMLQHLDISYCLHFTEGSIVNLINSELMTNMQYLDISGNQLTDITLRFIFTNTKLKSLSILIINDICKRQKGFTYKCIEYLAQSYLNKCLTKLSLANSFVNRDSIEPTKTNFILNKIRNEDHTFFTQLSLKNTTITQLILNRSELISNKFFRMLCKNGIFISSLIKIDIRHCKYIGDKSLIYMGECQNLIKLRELELAGLKITGNGLEKLAQSKVLALDYINLSMCDDITSNDLRTFLDTKLGRNLTQIELSGDKQINSLFAQESVIWKEYFLKVVIIELLIDKNSIYQIISKQQINQNQSPIEGYYKSFIEKYCFNLFTQLIFVRRLQIYLRIQVSDELQILDYLITFIEANRLLDRVLQNDNSLYVNEICFLKYLLEQITKANVKQIDYDQIQKRQEKGLIQQNYIDPIQNEGINASEIKNLIFMRQDNLYNEDLLLLGQYADSLFQSLTYLCFKGCKQITMKGIQYLGKLKDQLTFLDVRKTQIKDNQIFNLLQQFPKLESINNNKINLKFERDNLTQELVNEQLIQIFQLSEINNLSIICKVKQNKHNLLIIGRISKIIRNNYISLRRLRLNFHIHLLELDLKSEEKFIEFCENIQLCYKLIEFDFTLNGYILQQVVMDIQNALLGPPLQKLCFNFDNCVITNEGQFMNMGKQFQFLEELNFLIDNLIGIEQLLYYIQTLTILKGTFDGNKTYKMSGLLQLLSANPLQRIQLKICNSKNEYLIEILGSINIEHLNSLCIAFENVILNEITLQKIIDIVSKTKKLNQLELQMIGCQVNELNIEKYFKNNMQIVKIPQLKIYY